MARTGGTGILKGSDADALSTVGPMARASGVRYDIRKDHPYAAYDLVNWSMIIGTSGDVQSRVVVRMKELLQSTRIIRR